MVSSILTNNGAMTALQSLKATQKSLLSTQNRISTGLKVSTAKDNAATWAVATSMRSDISNFKQVSENLSLSSSVLSTAQSGGEAVSNLITQIKTKITAAQQGVLDSRTIQADIDELVKQVESTVQGSALKGVNLMNGEGQERIVASVNVVNGVSVPSYINVEKVNLSTAAGGDLNGLSTLSVVSRGDQLFNDASVADVTADQKAMGTTFFATTAGTYNATATPNSNMITNTAGDLTVGYKDATGATRSLTVKNIASTVQTATDLATALNADKDFAATFHATTDTGELRISAKDRLTQSGDFAISSVSGTKLTARTASTTSIENYSGSSFAFQDGTALKEGETFTFKYKVGTTEKTMVLKATNDFAAGAEYQSADTVNNIQYRAIKLDDANVKNNAGEYDGDNIAAAFLAAINPASNADFAATASATEMGVTVVGNTLTIKAYGGDEQTTTPVPANKFSSFQPVTTDYGTMLSNVDELMKTATNAAAAFGSAGARVDMQKEFMDKLVDTLTSGLGTLVDADMSEEAARLQALQVQEQLGTQALSIANQAPQSILRLFQ
ncbi:flagellin [Roseomonas haemaphysalidis]|uniref:Flagellin n=1 Tax=Roseomonas haemaphysalidis TaxID=2768162 RepID=A0ABS3KSS2_9PROT|nr:flagellin [Roseomonas haemaphysalidis]MBO1080513.1 flagellin [Roseomonas haemaphysalidis]